MKVLAWSHFGAILLVLTLSLIRVPLVTASEPVASPLAVTDCSYGDVYQFEAAGCSASIENMGATTLTLRVVPVQPGISVEPDKLTLAPHAHAELALHVLTENIAGPVTWAYRIEGVGKEPHFVHASGFVSSVVDVGHPSINFGEVDSTTLPITQTVTLKSSIDSEFRVAKILSSDPMFHARIGSDARSLEVRIGPDAPWGPFDHMIKLAIASAEQKQIWVEVTGDITADIGPPNNPYWLGEVTQDPGLSLIVPIVDRKGNDFSIGDVTSSEFAATYSQGPCKPPSVGCRNLLIHVSDAQPAGLFKSHIDVELLGHQKHLTVEIWGVLSEKRKPGEAVPSPAIAKIPVSTSRSQDFVSVSPPLKVQPDPPGNGPLLKWTVGGPQDGVYGYQVIRGDSSDGPFDLVGPRIIAKLDNGKGAVAYRWRDTSAVQGRTYWYYIAALYSSGDRKPLSEPHRTVAK
jgi:hypothetical protein